MTKTHKAIYSKTWRMWFYADWLPTGELCCLYPKVPSTFATEPHSIDGHKLNRESCLLNALEMVYHGRIPSIVLSSRETPFQQKIRALLWNLRPGTPVTYGQAAELLGSKKAAQAVGQACARNQFAVLVPCHRIVSSKGIGGYRWGIRLKSELLEIEQSSA